MIAGFEKFSQRISGCLWRGFIRPQATGITAVCRGLDAPEVQLFRNSAKIKAGIAGNFFVKRYNLPGIWGQIRRFFKTPRALAVLRGAEHLEKLSIPTPRVEAALTQWQGMYRREYLVTALLGANDQLMDKFYKQNTPEKTWQLILEKFLPMLAKLHDSGALHGDLNLRNIYLDGSGEAGLIDLDGMKITGKPLPGGKRAEEIARLVSGFLLANRPLPEYPGYVAQALQSYAAASGNTPDEKIVLSATEKFIRRAEKYL